VVLEIMLSAFSGINRNCTCCFNARLPPGLGFQSEVVTFLFLFALVFSSFARGFFLQSALNCAPAALRSFRSVISRILHIWNKFSSGSTTSPSHASANS
jgi:hypothetical protein